MLNHVYDYGGMPTSVSFNRHPDVCPHCKHALRPDFINFTLTSGPNDFGSILHHAYQCTLTSCKKMFIAEYRRSGQSPDTFNLRKCMPQTIDEPTLEDEACQISPDFQKIYSEAFKAELLGLIEICGVGYRKSLEYLIKDYCIHKKPDDEEKIKSAPLGAVIKNRIQDQRLKSCAERAAWLGNDETHYVRKWEEKDLSDLKILIDLACMWIRSEMLTEKYINEMSQP